MIVTVDITGQLVDIYLEKESYHERKLSREEAVKYFTRLLENNNILFYEHEGQVLGYVEFWRINYEQLGRIICKQPFSAYLEDITNGDICYLADIWIDPDYRDGKILKIFKLGFFQRNYNCKFFVGEPIAKHKNTVKIYRRSDYHG